ncbi:MAG TPA: spherulation-specific family 4 protein [Pseudonocardiaceae bacterium]|nr:spherulation-specific family 4 protein [Pseudonocardiaceae bacterium]
MADGWTVSGGLTASGGLVVPAYFHPAVDPAGWETLARSAPAVRMVVLNVASGPGEVWDTAFIEVVNRLRQAGIAVAGYVDTNYGRRLGPQIMVEIARYRKWYGTDSVFFDRVASGIEHVARYQALVASARALGTELVAFNHGTYPDPDFAEHADLLGTFEGEWSAFQLVDVPSWVHDLPAAKFFNLLYGTPARMDMAVRTIADERNVGSMYRTDRRAPNPWAGLPADFPNPVRPGGRDGAAFR